jgi:hypothetical protein
VPVAGWLERMRLVAGALAVCFGSCPCLFATLPAGAG